MSDGKIGDPDQGPVEGEGAKKRSGGLSSLLLIPKGRAARKLALATAAAWVSAAIVVLAVVLEVIHATGSYSAAGAAAAAYGLAAAFIGVPRSRLVDRYGPRRTLPWLTLTHVLALGAVILAGWTGAPSWVFVALTVVVSGSTPPLIGFARGRWSDVVPEDELPNVYALTAMLGDIAQIGGPPAVGLLASLVDPAAGLATAGLFAVLAVVILLRGLPAGTPADGADAEETPAEEETAVKPGKAPAAIRSAGLQTITVGGIAVGLGLGAVDVAVAALATAQGALWTAGFMLGALGVGGVVGSVLSPRIAAKLSPGARYVGGLAVLLVATAVPVLTSSAWLVAAALLVAGFAWGITNVGLYELLDIVVPKAQSTEAWTWLSTAESIGAAGGAALAGVLAGRSLPLAFALVPAAVAIALLFGLARRRTLVAPLGDVVVAR
jgi:MFS family permease